MLILLFVLLILALIGGGVGHTHYGFAGWSPAGLLIIAVVVLYFSGHLVR